MAAPHGSAHGLAARLREAAQGLSHPRVSLQEIAAAHGPAPSVAAHAPPGDAGAHADSAHGSWFVLLAAPCLLPVPGVGTVLGFGLLLLAAMLWRGQRAQALPARVAALTLPRKWALRVLQVLAKMYCLASRWSAPRWSGLTHGRARAGIAVVAAAMAVLIVLPIPMGNVLPALAVMLAGLGLALRDGLLVVLGGAVAGLAFLFVAALAVFGWQSVAALTVWFAP